MTDLWLWEDSCKDCFKCICMSMLPTVIVRRATVELNSWPHICECNISSITQVTQPSVQWINFSLDNQKWLVFNIRRWWPMHLVYSRYSMVWFLMLIGNRGIILETLSPSSSDDDNDEEYLPENDSSCHQVMRTHFLNTSWSSLTAFEYLTFMLLCNKIWLSLSLLSI